MADTGYRKRSRLPGRPISRWGWLALALLWLAFSYVCIVPLLRPHGVYGWGHYRIRDMYLGVPLGLATVAATLVAVSPARLRRDLALRLTTMIAAVLAAVLTSDVAFSFLFPPYLWSGLGWVPRDQCLPDPELGWVRKPGLSWVGPNPVGTRRLRYRTDEHGFRNPLGLRHADLVFIGDSFTEAAEVSEEESFVGRTGGATGLSVVNLGRRTYGPQQELIVLQKYGLSYQPRVVVWQICEHNDLTDAEQFVAWKRAPGRQPHLPLVFRYRRGSVVHSLIEKTACDVRPPHRSGSCRLRLRSGALRPQMLYARYLPDAPTRCALGFSATKQAIQEGNRVCRSRGIQLLVLFVPTAVRYLGEHVVFDDPADRERFLPGGAVNASGDFGTRLGSFCHQIDSPFHDLFPDLKARADQDPHSLIFADDEHLDTSGHQVVAQALLKWLGSRGLSGTGPTRAESPAKSQT